MLGKVSVASDRRLGAILVGGKVLAEPSLADALNRQRRTGHRLGTVLVDMGLADEKTIVAALAVQRDLPVADLRRAGPVDTVAMLPEELARTLSAVILRRTPLGLDVAVGEPLDGPALAQLEAVVDEPVLMRLAPPGDLQRIIDVTYARRELGHRSAGSEPSGCAGEPNDHGQRVLQAIVSDAVRAGASDVHLELGPAHTKLRYRVDGVLTEAASLPLRSGAAAVRRAENLTGAPKSGRRQLHPFTMTVDGCALRVLITATATLQGERVRLRVSTDDAVSRGRLEQLGMPSDIQTSLTTILQNASGLIVIAGRRGSGRTTTAYAAMAEVDTPQRSIIMLRRSFPRVLPSVSQIEIGSQPIGPAILATAVGQDADGVLIDDLEGAGVERAAIRMAQRGMLVVMTLTAVDMAATYAHFLGPSDRRSLLAGTRHAIVHQRLEHRDRPDVDDGRFMSFELDTDGGHLP